MRIIVYPHAMEIGGSQLNAIQLAGAVRDRGHEVVVVATILSSSIVPFFPRPIPLLVGTEQLQYAARDAGYPRVNLMEPPVDTDADRPGAGGAAFRARYVPDPDLPLAVMVCRLVPEL